MPREHMPILAGGEISDHDGGVWVVVPRADVGQQGPVGRKRDRSSLAGEHGEARMLIDKRVRLLLESLNDFLFLLPCREAALLTLLSEPALVGPFFRPR